MATQSITPNPDKLSNEDLTALAETYHHLKTAGDPRADKVGAFIGSQVRAGNVEPLTDQTKQSIAAYGFMPGNLLKNAWEGAKGVVTGAYAMGKDLATNPDWILDSHDESGNVTNKSTLEKFAFDPADAQADQAKQAFAQGHYSEAAGHGLAAIIPFLGPAAANIGDQAGSGDIGGALAKGTAQALTAAAPTMLADATAPLLRKSAKVQYMKALSPTKAENKFLAQKITPGLLDRGVSGSLEGINKTADAALDETGPQISAAVKAIPQAKTLAIQPVLDSLEAYKENFKVGSAEMRPDAVARVSELQDTIKQLGPDVSYASLNKARQIFDEVVSQGKGYYGKTLAEGGMLDVQREAANAMRSELAKDRPDIAKINAEYSFWSNVQKVTGDTIARRSGQEGALLPKLGGIGGAATGHAPTGVAMYYLGKVIQSPRWRTFSAIKKTQIANAIASGDAATVTKLIGVGAVAGQLSQAGQ